MRVESGKPVLTLDGVAKNFGGLAALTDVSFDVRRSEVIGLIGPNGAGKSTCINVLSGFFPADRGKIWFKGEDITHVPAHLVTLRGLVRTFQLPTFFQQATVLEHLTITCTQSLRAHPLRIFLNTLGWRRTEGAARKRAQDLIELSGLGPFAGRKPRELSTGWQRWLGLTMALALEPTVLLLDEPLAGLSASQIDKTLALLKEVQKEREMSILMVAHQMRAVMSFCDRIVVLHFGRKICEGDPSFVRNDQAVVDAYLGGDDGAPA